MKKYLVLLVVIALLVTGCAAPQNRTEEGTRKGAALGAIGGAVLG
jgi:uncharacterized protein YcfL